MTDEEFSKAMALRFPVKVKVHTDPFAGLHTSPDWPLGCECRSCRYVMAIRENRDPATV